MAGEEQRISHCYTLYLRKHFFEHKLINEELLPVDLGSDTLKECNSDNFRLTHTYALSQQGCTKILISKIAV